MKVSYKKNITQGELVTFDYSRHFAVDFGWDSVTELIGLTFTKKSFFSFFILCMCTLEKKLFFPKYTCIVDLWILLSVIPY